MAPVTNLAAPASGWQDGARAGPARHEAWTRRATMRRSPALATLGPVTAPGNWMPHGGAPARPAGAA